MKKRISVLFLMASLVSLGGLTIASNSVNAATNYNYIKLGVGQGEWAAILEQAGCFSNPTEEGKWPYEYWYCDVGGNAVPITPLWDVNESDVPGSETKPYIEVYAYGSKIPSLEEQEFTIRQTVDAGASPEHPPAVVPGASDSSDTTGGIGADPSTKCPENSFGLKICDDTTDPDAAKNAIPKLVTTILNWALIGVGTVVVIFVVIGGMMYMTAAGSQERAKQGMTIIRNAVLGLVLYLVMITVLNFIIPGVVFSGT